jgi:uncharacterized membrane protein
VDTVTEQITIGRPREEVADQLQRIEEHPELFTDADEVQLVGEDRYRWTFSVGPLERETEAHVTRSSDELLTWRATAEGFSEAGEIRLIGEGPGRTTLRLSVAYEIDDTLLKMADAVGLLERRIRGNLEAFKDHLEDRRHLEGDSGDDR